MPKFELAKILDGIELDDENLEYLTGGGQEQIEQILGQMSPYSLGLFLNGINNGQISGSFFRSEYASFHELEGGSQYFSGCLLGWAGFLEIANFGQLDLGETRQHFGFTQAYEDTSYAECFIAGIRIGLNPENCKNSLVLARLVQAEIDSREAVANA